MRYDDEQRIRQHVGGKMVACGRAALLRVARAVFPMLVPFLVPIIIVLLIGLLLYMAMFALPKYIVEGGGSPVVIYHTGYDWDEWTPEEDARLQKRYVEVNEDWLRAFQSTEALSRETVRHSSGNAANPVATVKDVWGAYMRDSAEQLSNIVAPREQARRHALPWAVMAGIDRMLGDPLVTGGETRMPQPEKHFRALEPELEWETFELYYYRTWTEEDDEGNAVTYVQEYRHPIKMLKSAKDYEADFTYEWREKVIEEAEAGYYLKVIVPEWTAVHRQGPYYWRLHALMAEHGFERMIDTEMVLQLAAHMDDDFILDAHAFGSMVEFGVDISELGIYEGPLGPITWPTTGTITSEYGWRIHPVRGGRRFHAGIDIANAVGTPVVAAANGRVVYAIYTAGYGNCVLINHGEIYTFYAHLDRFTVRAGMEVDAGQEIGKMGNTGISTGPHLHFEVRKAADGTRHINPRDWLPPL